MTDPLLAAIADETSECPRCQRSTVTAISPRTGVETTFHAVEPHEFQGTGTFTFTLVADVLAYHPGPGQPRFAMHSTTCAPARKVRVREHERDPPTPRARRADPQTSHDAAASAAPNVATIRARVLTILRDDWPSGLTDEWLIDRYRERHGERAGSDSGIRTRRAELCIDGLVHPIGTATTRAGRETTIWAARPREHDEAT